MTPQDLVTIHEITQLKYRYMRAVDTQDWDLLATVFTANARTWYSSGTLSASGRDNIVAMLSSAMKPSMYTSHIAQWLRARDTGALAAQAEQIARLEQEKRQLEQDVDVQARLRALLKTVAESAGIEAHRAQRPEAVR